MSEVLDEFLKRTTLLEEDRKSLRQRRGFDDIVINSHFLRSASADNKAIIEKLIADFDASGCVDNGLAVVRHGKAIPTTKLIDRNIIIPYMEDGTCVQIRPHKQFMKGGTLSVYYADESYDQDALTIITEGEFKAIAASVYGYQAIAIPGISSFLGDRLAGKKFLGFYEDLALKGVREITFLFDNEEKGDVTLPKYKEEPSKRYDVQYFAYLMASKVNEYGADMTANIGWIPDKYRDSEGKADIDGMLSVGIKSEAFDEILEKAYEPEEFLSEDLFSEEAVNIIHEKLTRRSDRVKFLVRNGRYIYRETTKKGEIEEIIITNFTMEHIATYLDEDENFLYEFKLRNVVKFENTVRLTGEEVSSKNKFRAAIMSRGLFLWYASSDVLDELLVEVIPEDPRVIHIKREVGWDEELNCYFFDNCILTESAEIVALDKDRIVEVAGKNYCVEYSTVRPIINFDSSADKIQHGINSIQDITKRLIKNFGTDEVVDIMAWFIAAAYKPWLFPINRTFPILGVFGQKNSGKSRLLQWLLRIFYEKNDGILFDSSTKPGIRNQLTLFQYLPVWLDEFRNSRKGKTYLELLRGVYDHSTILMSSKVYGKNITFPLRASLILSGEHIPDDETGAVNQRIISVHLKKEPVGTEFQWFEQHYYSFSGILTFLLKNRTKLIPRIIAEYDSVLESYRKRKDIDQRVAINYSLIHAIEYVILGRKGTRLSAEETFKEIKQDDADKDLLVEMIMTCLLSYDNRNITPSIRDHMDVRFDNSDNTTPLLVFNFRAFCSVYNESLRRQNRTPITWTQIRRQIKECSWIRNEDKLFRIRKGSLKKPVRCYIVTLEEAPEEIAITAVGLAQDGERKRMEHLFGGEDGIMPKEDDDLTNYGEVF